MILLNVNEFVDIRSFTCIHASIFAVNHPSIYPSIYLSFHSFILPSIHPFIVIALHPPIYPSIYPSIYLSIHPSIYLSIGASMFVCVSMCGCVSLCRRFFREACINGSVSTQRLVTGPGPTLATYSPVVTHPLNGFHWHYCHWSCLSPATSRDRLHVTSPAFQGYVTKGCLRGTHCQISIYIQCTYRIYMCV